MTAAVTTRSNGFAEMAYVGEKAWHGLGQELQADATIEEWQVASGMDFRIQRSKVRYFTAPNATAAQQFEMDSHHVLFRDDNKSPMGIVSPGYKIVQPKAVLEFFRDLVADSGYTLNTAGTLFGGKKFWALAKVAEACVVGQDKVGGYLLLATSCDGSMATECRETTVRVVCNNTLSMARSEGKADAKISHRTRFDPAAMKAKLGLTRDHFEDFMQDARLLAGKQITNAEADAFVRELLRPAKKVAPVAAEVNGFADLLDRPATLSVIDEEENAKRAPKGEKDILQLFRGSILGQGMNGASGTAWGLVNAVTAFVDHGKQAKSHDHRLDSAFFGDGDALKNRAFDLAFSL